MMDLDCQDVSFIRFWIIQPNSHLKKSLKNHIFTSLPPTICWSSSLCTENASWRYYSQWWYFYLKERSSLITSRVLKYGSSRSPSLPRSTLSSSTVTGTSNLPLQVLSLASSDSPPDSIFPQKSRRLQSTATKLRKSVCKGKGRHQSSSIPRAGKIEYFTAFEKKIECWPHLKYEI